MPYWQYWRQHQFAKRALANIRASDVQACLSAANCDGKYLTFNPG